MTEPPIVNQPPLASTTAAAKVQGNRVQVPGPTEKSALIDQRWFVLAAIFLATMFLGLPLLWRCPTFSRLEKFVWTILTLVYSAVLIWVFILIMSWSWRNISNSL